MSSSTQRSPDDRKTPPTDETAPKHLRVFLHNDGEDVESVWAVPVGTLNDKQLVRLANIPFLHAKPTYGDVLLVEEDKELEFPLAWNRNSVSWSRIAQRIHKDGGRYAGIIDYRLHKDLTFRSLCDQLEANGTIATEGCYGERADSPGRLYLAVADNLSVADWSKLLNAVDGLEWWLEHPKPARKKKKKAAKRTAKKTKKTTEKKAVKKATKKAAKKAAKKTTKKTTKKPATKRTKRARS